jgi:hypothetical protein
MDEQEYQLLRRFYVNESGQWLTDMSDLLVYYLVEYVWLAYLLDGYAQAGYRENVWKVNK